MTQPRSMRQAINAKCRECIYDPIGGEGTWRQQTGSCASANCALHPFRPRPATSRKDKADASNE